MVFNSLKTAFKTLFYFSVETKGETFKYLTFARYNNLR